MNIDPVYSSVNQQNNWRIYVVVTDEYMWQYIRRLTDEYTGVTNIFKLVDNSVRCYEILKYLISMLIYIFILIQTKDNQT
jgi:hypothetical protein